MSIMRLLKYAVGVGVVMWGIGWTVGASPAEPRDVPVALSGHETADPAAFFGQLAGEWSMVAEALPGPGQEPVRTEGREVARFLGERWLVAETNGRLGELPFTQIFTLGWDPGEERFVATFISSMQSHMWSYAGVLDESETALTLETEGPFMGDPAQTAEYRVIIDVEGPDLKVMRSLILGPDGAWFEFSRAEYRR
jgi:hypothetical protein